MSITILRPSQRILTIPGGGAGIEFIQRATQPGGDADWWDPNGDGLSCVAAWQAVGAASYAASLVDLTGNGNDCTDSEGAPSWNASTGWTFNGSNQCLNTNVIPLAGTWSYIIRYANGSTTNNRRMFGINQASDRVIDIETYYGGNNRFRNGAYDYSGGSAATSGVIAMADRKGYLDAVEMTTGLAAWSGTGVYPCRIGASGNWGSSPMNYWDGDVLAVAIYDETLSASDISDIGDAMDALAA